MKSGSILSISESADGVDREMEINRKVTINHLELSATLKQHASKVLNGMKFQAGPCIPAMRRRGVCVMDYGKGDIVECLSQQFPIDQQFVWLEKSATLGLELRAVRQDGEATSRVLAKLILRPDGRALVRGVDREFSRCVVHPQEIDATASAFLAAVANSAIVGLPQVSF